VAMLCIWRSGIGVSVSVCVLGGMGIHLYSSGSSVQTAIKAHCIHIAESPVFEKRLSGSWLYSLP
jgi:hypothetical protein